MEIKPLSNGAGAKAVSNVDELQKAVGGLELVPPPLVSNNVSCAFHNFIDSLLKFAIL